MGKPIWTCETCGAEFASYLRDGKVPRFCSVACRDAGKRVDLTCAYCGATFTRSRVIAGRTETPYCSAACYKAAGRVETTCANPDCGKPITVDRSKYDSNGGRCFCSWACKCAGYFKPSHPVQVVCDQCGTAFDRPLGEHNNAVRTGAQHHFCSRRCKAAYMRTVRGPAHPLWQGGSSYFYGPNWPDQRDAARARDGYRCQGCGLAEREHRRALDVHHRIPFRSFGYIPDENDAYLAANDLSNLVTLCPSCHVLAECGALVV